MLYMVTFTINIPQMLAYIPYMDPMGDDPSHPLIRSLIARLCPRHANPSTVLASCTSIEVFDDLRQGLSEGSGGSPVELKQGNRYQSRIQLHVLHQWIKTSF